MNNHFRQHGLGHEQKGWLTRTFGWRWIIANVFTLSPIVFELLLTSRIDARTVTITACIYAITTAGAWVTKDLLLLCLGCTAVNAMGFAVVSRYPDPHTVAAVGNSTRWVSAAYVTLAVILVAHAFQRSRSRRIARRPIADDPSPQAVTDLARGTPQSGIERWLGVAIAIVLTIGVLAGVCICGFWPLRSAVSFAEGAGLVVDSLRTGQPVLTLSQANVKPGSHREETSGRLYETITDMRVFDFRAMSDALPNSNEATQLVAYSRLLRFRPKYGLETITLRVVSSGSDLAVSSDPSPRAVWNASENLPNRMKQTRMLDIPVNREDEQTIVVRAVHVNAFKSQENLWIGAEAPDGSTSSITIIALFSESLRPAEYWRECSSRNRPLDIAIDGEGPIVVDSEHRWIAWRIDTPIAGALYKLKWRWRSLK